MFFLLLSLAEAIISSSNHLKSPQTLTTTSNTSSSPHPIKNFFNQFYFLEVSIGSPNKKFEMLLDTGSNTLWVPDVQCKNCQFSSSFFNISESPSSVSKSPSTSEVFFQSNVTGALYQDNLKIGSLEVQDVEFLSITEQSGYSSIPCDGVLGLAFSDRKQNQLNLVDLMKSQGLIKESSFSLYLNYNLEDENLVTDPSAKVIFGGFDESLAIENFHFIKIKRSTGYWMAGLIDMQADIIRDGQIINNTELMIISSDVIFNTGSRFITFPKTDYDKIMSFVTEDYYCYDSDGIINCLCESLDDYPVFRMNIEYKEFEIRPEQYVQRDSGFCAIMIVPNNEIDIVTLGIPFFLKYYSYFNYETAKLGLALSVVDSQKVVESANHVLTFALVSIVCFTFVAFKKNFKKEADYKRLE